VQKLAEFRGITPEQMAKITYENACRFFFNWCKLLS
jgi:Tat protein secretion system quality control protein TatD with DNase activity